MVKVIVKVNYLARVDMLEEGRLEIDVVAAIPHEGEISVEKIKKRKMKRKRRDRNNREKEKEKDMVEGNRRLVRIGQVWIIFILCGPGKQVRQYKMRRDS